MGERKHQTQKITRNAEYIRAEALSYVTQPFRAEIHIPNMVRRGVKISEVQSSKFKVQSSKLKFKVQNSKFKVQDSRFKVDSSKLRIETQREEENLRCRKELLL